MAGRFDRKDERSSYTLAGVLSLLLLVSLLRLVSLLGSGLAAEALLGAASGLASGLAAGSSPVTEALLDLRLSVIYQPEPLNTMPTGWNTRRTALAHDGQVRSGS